MISKASQLLGALIHRCKGPSKTLVYQGQTSSSVKRLRVGDDEFEVTLLSRRVVYHTQYVRKWIPDTKRSVFVVSAKANGEVWHRLDESVLKEISYPMLSNALLKWTDIPHYIAIDAYLDHVISLLSNGTRGHVTKLAM